MVHPFPLIRLFEILRGSPEPNSRPKEEDKKLTAEIAENAEIEGKNQPKALNSLFSPGCF